MQETPSLKLRPKKHGWAPAPEWLWKPASTSVSPMLSHCWDPAFPTPLKASPITFSIREPARTFLPVHRKCLRGPASPERLASTGGMSPPRASAWTGKDDALLRAMETSGKLFLIHGNPLFSPARGLTEWLQTSTHNQISPFESSLLAISVSGRAGAASPRTISAFI